LNIDDEAVPDGAAFLKHGNTREANTVQFGQYTLIAIDDPPVTYANERMTPGNIDSFIV
jgi:hypothetical protein